MNGNSTSLELIVAVYSFDVFDLKVGSYTAEDLRPGVAWADDGYDQVDPRAEVRVAAVGDYVPEGVGAIVYWQGFVDELWV
jgi:hypothetical protein